jgi:hypothetical protein
MGKTIKSPHTFKTSYIAAVKEELGLLKRKLKPSRKITPPARLKWAIVEALKKKPNATYKEIQELAFKIFKEKERNELPFYGTLGKVDPDLLEEILNDKELPYED